MAVPKALPSDLQNEYRLCHERASTLADNVWRTATLLGVGSIAGIAALANIDRLTNRLGPWLIAIVALLAIGFLLAWRRMAGRWLSIEYALLRRMEHLERVSTFRATLYTARLDDRVTFSTSARASTTDSPFLDQALDDDLNKIDNHQREGIRAAVTFITELNIAGWLAFALFSFSPLLAHSLATQPHLAIVLLTTVVFVAFFLWRLIHMTRQL